MGATDYLAEVWAAAPVSWATYVNGPPLPSGKPMAPVEGYEESIAFAQKAGWASMYPVTECGYESRDYVRGFGYQGGAADRDGQTSLRPGFWSSLSLNLPNQEPGPWAGLWRNPSYQDININSVKREGQMGD